MQTVGPPSTDSRSQFRQGSDDFDQGQFLIHEQAISSTRFTSQQVRNRSTLGAISMPVPATEHRYSRDTTLRIYRHLPPEPFTGYYGPSPRPPTDWSRWEGKPSWEIDRFELALTNPPLETAAPGPLERTLTITGVKTIRERGGAHVVTCFLDGDQSAEYVAKIYDGVDYPLGPREPDEPGCMYYADKDYSIEAWAYRTMQPLIGGTFVPAYHGSWTFSVSRNQPGSQYQQQRWVRMILIELVQGDCMLNLIKHAEDINGQTTDFTLLPPESFRIRVLQNVFEARLFIWWCAAVKHEDVEPRNVMVKPDGSVVLIDFNHAYIYDFAAAPGTHPRERNPTSLPPSPIYHYWVDFCGSIWRHWMPDSWLEDKALATAWLVNTYRNDARFAPPPEWWLDWSQHKREGEERLRLLESLGRKPAGVENTGA